MKYNFEVDGVRYRFAEVSTCGLRPDNMYRKFVVQIAVNPVFDQFILVRGSLRPTAPSRACDGRRARSLCTTTSRRASSLSSSSGAPGLEEDPPKAPPHAFAPSTGVRTADRATAPALLQLGGARGVAHSPPPPPPPFFADCCCCR